MMHELEHWLLGIEQHSAMKLKRCPLCITRGCLAQFKQAAVQGLVRATVLKLGMGCREHFTLKQREVEDCCSKWTAECSNKGIQKQMKAALADINKGFKTLLKGKQSQQQAATPSLAAQIINLF